VTAPLRVGVLCESLASQVFLKGSKEMEITDLHTDWLRRHSWKVTDYHSHGSEHALSDFHLSGPLKNHPTGKRLAKDAEVKEAVTFWLETPDTHFFYAWIQALVPWRVNA